MSIMATDVPRHFLDDLDASERDVAEGRVHDAMDVQAEARRMLADYERSQDVSFSRRP